MGVGNIAPVMLALPQPIPTSCHGCDEPPTMVLGLQNAMAFYCDVHAREARAEVMRAFGYVIESEQPDGSLTCRAIGTA